MIKHEYAELSDKKAGIIKSITAVTKGTAGGYVLLIICFAVLALVYTYTSFPAGMLKPFVTGITALSLIFCGILTARSIDFFGWLHGVFAGILYTVIRYIFGAVFLNGFGFNTATLSMFLLGIVLGAAGGILGINFKK